MFDDERAIFKTWTSSTIHPCARDQAPFTCGVVQGEESVEAFQQFFVKAKCFLKAPERTGCCMSCSTQARYFSNKVLITPARIISVGGKDFSQKTKPIFVHKKGAVDDYPKKVMIQIKGAENTE